MSNIQPHRLDSEAEIESYLEDLPKERLHEVPEHLSRVHDPKLKEFFMAKARERGWVG